MQSLPSEQSEKHLRAPPAALALGFVEVSSISMLRVLYKLWTRSHLVCVSVTSYTKC